MDPRFVEDLRYQTLALSEEAVALLARHDTARDRKTEAGLRRTAAHTWLTTLLMDAVAWLVMLDPKLPHRRSMRLATLVSPREVAEPGDIDPALADLVERVVAFHRRLEHIEARLDIGFDTDPAEQSAAPTLTLSPADVPIKS